MRGGALGPGGCGDQQVVFVGERHRLQGSPWAPARVVEFQAPAEGVPGRLSWTARQDGTPEERLDVPHAWLVEDLPGGRVRILTQETRIGRPPNWSGRRRTRCWAAIRRGWTAWSAPPKPHSPPGS
ncbi:hypothetical protein GCM10010300_25390 [Streptomyces olivaceoviridis]|nr:hypothetical protein GCM10010300_25390 [Streptomyces olivaceoviridis]